MKTAWKSNRSIVSDWEEDSEGRSASLRSLKKWANDEVRKLYTVEQYSKQIAFINIEDSYGNLPDNFHKVIQAGYRDDSTEKKHVLEHKAIEWVGKNDNVTVIVRDNCHVCGKRYPKSCNCPEPMFEYAPNLYDKAAHPEWYPRLMGLGLYNIGRVGQSAVHGDCPYFRLMRPRTNSFFNINAHIPGCVNLNVGSKVTYEIHENNNIEVNIKKGKIILSYFGYRMDNEGFYMIPDIPEVWESIKKYIDREIIYAKWSKTSDVKYGNHFSLQNNLYKEAHAIAKTKLARVEPERLKAAWDNVIGKQIPHAYAEETYYEYVDDTFMRIR